MLGASVLSSVVGASSANKAAKAQENAANSDRALQKEMYESQQELFRPAYESGLDYAKVRNYLDGIGDIPTLGGTAPEISTITTPGTLGTQGERGAPPIPGTAATTSYNVGGNSFNTMDAAQDWANANKTGGTQYGGMQETDAYKFRVNEGVNAIDAGAAARGGLYSGKAMQDLQTYGQGQADQFENNYYSRISGGAAQGQAAAAQTALAGQQYAQANSNALSNIGNAQAAGAIGIGNALQGGINNGMGLYQYQNNLNSSGGNSPLSLGNWNFGAI